MLKYFKYLVVGILLFTSKVTWGLNIVYLSPCKQNSDCTYWNEVQNFMEKAASDLDIKLTVLNDSYDINFREQLSKVEMIKRLPKKPDYIILSPLPAHISLKTINAIEALKIPFFIISGELPISEINLFGKPRAKFKYWLGHLYGDNQQSGYLQMEVLNKLSPNGKVVALAGSHQHSESEYRLEGLRQFSKSNQNAIQQIVPTNWTEQQGFDKTEKLLSRYKNVNLIWTAGHRLAFGSSRAINKERSDSPVYLGTVNWTPDVYRAIKADEIHVAVGGHSISGALALVLIKDYHHGIDFDDINNSYQIPLTFKAITKHNIDETTKQFNAWMSFNFKNLSLYFNKNINQHFINVFPPKSENK